MLTLSVVMPCFNEERSVCPTLDALERVAHQLSACGIAMEIVAVDDGSTDATFDRLVARQAASPVPIVAIRHDINRGKGAAIRSARQHVTGDFVIFQDADMELEPADIPSVVAPLVSGRADAVLGSRFAHDAAERRGPLWHRLGNRAITALSNLFTGLSVTDMETGYKAFSAAAFRELHLTTDRFGMEPEIVARLAQMRARMMEVPVSYSKRSYKDGKKITWHDGFAAIGHIVRAHRSAHAQRTLQPPESARPAAKLARYRTVASRAPTESRMVSEPGAQSAPSENRAT